MRAFTVVLLLLISIPATAAQPYAALVAGNRAERDVKRSVEARRERLVEGFDAVTRAWLGTTWGLGVPQTKVPGEGKINCGTFVGRVLHDLGFELDVKRLQRQPAELIIKSLAPKDAIMRFRNRPMDELIGRVKATGDGVYIIGLDFHVGFLRVRQGEVRFVHASYVTGDVVDEPAATAVPIVTSKYRVVGKIFDDDLVRAWAEVRTIRIRGSW